MSGNTLSAGQALEQLREGNQRFVDGRARIGDIDSAACKRLVSGQSPFAVILGCSDSRVPVEIVFDQGLGDLFVIRIAGNIVAPSQIGSIEFAAQAFGTQLVVVLGHTQCGAVKATLDAIQHPTQSELGNVDSIIAKIKPAIEPLCKQREVSQELIDEAVRLNVLQSVRALRSGSSILSDLLAQGQLHIVGAEYALETGAVEFFDED